MISESNLTVLIVCNGHHPVRHHVTAPMHAQHRMKRLTIAEHHVPADRAALCMQVAAQDTGAGISGGPHLSLHQVYLKNDQLQQTWQAHVLLIAAHIRACAVARAQLKDLGIPFKQYSKPAGARTGVVGTLGSGEPRFLLRSDIDALPITVMHSDSVHDCLAETCSQAQGIRSLQEVLPLHIVAPGSADGHSSSQLIGGLDAGRPADPPDSTVKCCTPLRRKRTMWSTPAHSLAGCMPAAMTRK